MRKRRSGFTMVELAIVLVVLAIIATIAAPSMSRIVARQRVKSTATDLHLALIKARSEAVKRNTTATLAPISGTDWNTGWRVTVSGSAVDVTQPRNGIVISTAPTGVGSIVYRYDGRTSSGVRFRVRDAASTSLRCVEVDASGRPYVSENPSC